MISLSHARRRGARKGPAFFRPVLALCAILATAPSFAAEITIDAQDDRVAVSAIDASIRDILQALVDENLLQVDSALALPERVSLKTRPEPLATLLRRLLREHSYSLAYNTQQQDAPATASSGSIPQLRIFASDDSAVTEPWRSASGEDADDLVQAIADLADPDAEVRENAVLTLSDLGDSGDHEFLEHFISSLEDPDMDVRDAARAAIEDMETTDFDLYRRLNQQPMDE